MQSDGSLDVSIKDLEERIRDRREALRASVADLAHGATLAKQRIQQKAASPLVWGGALVLGFVVARLARRVQRHRPAPRRRYVEAPVSPGRQVFATVLTAALPIALRIAQQSAGPWIARTLHAAQRNFARRRPPDDPYSRY